MGVIVSILTKLGIAKLAGGAGLALGALAIKSILPKLLHNFVGIQLGHALDATDPIDKELVRAIVTWAEKKYPAAGAGAEKFKVVGKKLASFFPLSTQMTIETMVEKALEDLEAEVLATAKNITDAPPA